jgi:hypothetical protein
MRAGGCPQPSLAAALWGFLDWDEARYPEVTVRGSAARRHPGLRAHRTRTLRPRDVTRRDGIPVTTPARALLDVACELPPKGLRRAARQAQAMHGTNVRQIADVLGCANGRRGAVRLAADGPAPTRSEFEDIVLDLILGAGLRRPVINERLGAPSFPTCAGPTGGSPSSATAPPGTTASSRARTTPSARPAWRRLANGSCA